MVVVVVGYKLSIKTVYPPQKKTRDVLSVATKSRWLEWELKLPLFQFIVSRWAGLSARLYKPVPLRLYLIGGGVAQRRRGPIDLSTSGR